MQLASPRLPRSKSGIDPVKGRGIPLHGSDASVVGNAQ
jgi:hypothetical protein